MRAPMEETASGVLAVVAALVMVPVSDGVETGTTAVVRRESEMVRTPVEETASGVLAMVAPAGEELLASTGAAADKDAPEVRRDRERTRTGGATSALVAESATVDEGAADAAEGAVRRVRDMMRAGAALPLVLELVFDALAVAASSAIGALTRRVMERVRTPATVWTAPETARLSAAGAAGSDAGVLDGRRVIEMVLAPIADDAGAA